MLQPWHLFLSIFYHYPLLDLLNSIRLVGECQCRHFYSSKARIDQVKVWLWLAHSMTFTNFFRSHSFLMLAVCVVLLENELSPQSEVNCTLQQVIAMSLWIVTVQTSVLLPAAWEHPTVWWCHHHTSLLTRWWYVPENMTPGIQDKDFNLCFIWPNLLSLIS